jgi:NAD(P)-dependent dehydrogenase (short-subunit alcohol dehydrogenase family)
MVLVEPLSRKVNMDLNNRVAVITGATGGLGSIVTRELAARGTALALLDKDPAKLEVLAESLSLPKSRLFTQCVDLLDPLETNSVAQAVTTKFGRIDILLHLVGGWTGGKSLFAAGCNDLTFMINQHVWTSFNVTQVFVPHLVSNGWGRVIMITSPYASRPNASGGPYAIGKAGQEALMLTLSQELRGTGVTANLLQAKTIDGKREKVSAPTPDNAAWTTPEELTAAVLYLLSDEAGTVNGAKIPLFGSF